MTMEEVQSYTVLRIREIAVGKSVYAAAAPPGNVAATVTPPLSPPLISKPERSPIELPPPVAAQLDARVAPKVASEERAGTQPQGAQPSSDALHPVQAVESPPSALSSTEAPPARVTPLPRVETAAPTPALEREPRKRSYGIAAVVVAVLVIAAGLLVWGGGQPSGPAEVATVAAPAQAVRTAVPQPAAKAP